MPTAACRPLRSLAAATGALLALAGSPARAADDHGHDHGTAPAAAAHAPAAAHGPAPAHAPSGSFISPGLALQLLDAGNLRFRRGDSLNPGHGPDRRTEVAGGQRPFAIILACSDSRVPPEILFDQGLGDLFVIRVAGNIIDDHALGSIEYAVEHLGSRLLVVLGHERCGAVTAAVSGGYAGGHVHSIVEALEPAVEAARSQEGDPVANAISAKVHLTARRLSTSQPFLAPRVASGALQVIGALYDLDSGEVTWLQAPPTPATSH